MGCIGSPNYINLSPYKLISSSQRHPKSFASHWFLIQVISSVIDLYTFGHSEQIYFSSENMVSNGWFKMYLNQNQVKFLEDSTYFSLYLIESKNEFLIKKSNEQTKFFVHASKDWKPPSGIQILSKISDTIFYVENLEIYNDEIKNDLRVLKIVPQAGTKQPLNRFITGYLQTGHQKSVYSNNIYAPIRTLHNIGLNGSNEVVNVVDSGVDLSNAFFYDPENDLSSVTGKTNVNHRKVVRIENIVDNTDEYKGHGTHVSGTVCGAAYCTDCGISQYNGVAPASKLYFSDIGNSTSGELSGTVDLEEQYKMFKELDVHVSSNSWGYSYNNREVEFNYNKAAFDHPDVLYVFAAGNSQAYNTINCPGSSKNVMSVSAASFISSAYLGFAQSRVEIQNETFSFIQGKEITKSFIFENSVNEPMKYYINLTLKPFIEDETSADYYKDTVVVLNNETSDDKEICQRAQKVSSLGALAAIFLTDKTEFYCDEIRSMIPIVKLVNKDNLSVLFDMKKVTLFPFSGEEKKLPSADFLSSKGPADSGLRKPDIIIPGANIFSAKSHGPDLEDVEIDSSYDENVCVMSGSSMATPAASGLALIIRQYLKEGFYPSLKKNPENSVENPSSCLLRALLVNTAIKPDSQASESKSLPRKDVGFGTPFLNNILGFNDTGLRFVDNEKIGTKSHHVYRIKLDSNSADLSVTLVYLDPPLDVDNEANLFADLDLYVKSPKGQIYYGNNVSDGDTLSVIEKVVFDKNEIQSDGGEFEIHVVSNNFPIDSQNVMYSIVVNGPFEMADVESNSAFLKTEEASENDCPNGCNGNGKCEKAQCVCNDAFVGNSCGTKIDDLNDGESHEEVLNYGDLKYFRIPLNEKVKKIDFDIVRSDVSGYVYFCTSLDQSPGKLTNSGWSCYLACKSNDPSSRPSFGNYSFEINHNQRETNPKFFNLAFYTGYNKKQTVKINNIKLTFSELPTDEPHSTSQSSSSTTSQSSSSTISQSLNPGKSDEDNEENEKLPVFVFVLMAFVGIMVITSILLVPWAICKRKEKEAKSSVSISLMSNQDF